MTNGLFGESVDFKYSKTNLSKEEQVRENSEYEKFFGIESDIEPTLGTFLEALSAKVLSLIKCFATQIYSKGKNIKISCQHNM